MQTRSSFLNKVFLLSYYDLPQQGQATRPRTHTQTHITIFPEKSNFQLHTRATFTKTLRRFTKTQSRRRSSYTHQRPPTHHQPAWVSPYILSTNTFAIPITFLLGLFFVFFFKDSFFKLTKFKADKDSSKRCCVSL